MAQEKANYAVTMMARVLEVSRSGFYAWSKRRGTLGTRRARQQDLDEQVRWFHDRSRGTYGAPRITADLHDAGVDVDRKTPRPVHETPRPGGIVDQIISDTRTQNTGAVPA